MADVVPDQITEQKQGNKHTCSGQEQVLPIIVTSGEPAVQQVLDQMYQPGQYYGRKTGTESDDEAQQQQNFTF